MPSPYQTSKGTMWRATWADDTGRQRSKSFSTRDGANAWERKMRLEKEAQTLGINTRARDTTLDEWVLLWWKLHICSGDGRVDRPGNTKRSYQRAINRLISPYVGGLTMDQLTPPRLAQWRDDLTADGWSAHQVIEAMRVLSSCLSRAVEVGLIPSGANPLRNVSKPPKPPRKKKLVLSPLAVEWVRQAMLSYQYGRHDDLTALRSATLTSVLAYGGLRPSEALGLKVEDVDFEAGGLWVNDVFAVEHREGDTKTHESGRFVELWEPVMDDLRSWLTVREALEGKLRRRGWLFPDEQGDVTEYTHRNFAGRPWKRARERAAELAPEFADELLAATPYTMRHSAVSVYVRAEGADLDWAALAERMGHTVETLRANYLHVISAARRVKKRLPVEVQIAEARTVSGSSVSASSLHDRLMATAPPMAKLVDLQAKRQRRRAV